MGNPKLSAVMIFGLLNALIEAVQEIYAVLMVFLLDMAMCYMRVADLQF